MHTRLLYIVPLLGIALACGPRSVTGTNFVPDVRTDPPLTTCPPAEASCLGR